MRELVRTIGTQDEDSDSSEEEFTHDQLMRMLSIEVATRKYFEKWKLEGTQSAMYN